MRNKIKNENAITLVALVITIIVLLILAGVTLSIVWNTNIIGKSQNAVDQYKNSSANETNQIEFMENMFEKLWHNANQTRTTN